MQRCHVRAMYREHLCVINCVVDTYTGDITIAINPYQWLPELYTEKQQMLYAERERSELPPHVYATSVAAYDKLRLEAQNQSILVSGESGILCFIKDFRFTMCRCWQDGNQ